MTNSAHFTPALFDFLADLAENNNREWFQENKSRYEKDVRNALVQFVADFGERLYEISPHMVADPRLSGGSIFRIYRDVRFSKDKSPYKTNAGVHFRHEVGRKVHGPGLYLHLQPGMVFAGAGILRPDSATVGKIRNSIVSNPDRWSDIVNDDRFSSVYALEGESLKRPPRGIDPDHPLIDHLKLKSFAATVRLTEDDACAPDFIDMYSNACAVAAPFSEFLTRAVGLDW